MAQFKVGDTVEIKLFGNVSNGSIIIADELKDEYRVAYKIEEDAWFGAKDMILLDTPKAPKTADEMFAELGYIYNYETGGFGYVGYEYKWKQPCNGAEKILLFNDIDKELQVHNETDYHLSPNEIKAIHKKLEELGWL
jgi:hypothetical protein